MGFREGQLADELLDWLKTLRVTQGRRAGQPITIMPWQSQFIRGCWREDVQEGLITVARGNGKTTLFAAIAAASVAGPLALPRSETVVVASSFAQAKILFDHTKAFLRDELESKRATYRVVDNFQTCLLYTSPSPRD